MAHSKPDMEFSASKRQQEEEDDKEGTVDEGEMPKTRLYAWSDDISGNRQHMGKRRPWFCVRDMRTIDFAFIET